MALEDGTSFPIAEDSLTDLAKKLVTALQKPETVSIGSFASIVERLHGELTMMKDHQEFITTASDAIENDWPEPTEPGSMPAVLTPGQVEILSAVLAPE